MNLGRKKPSITIDFYDGYYSGRWKSKISEQEFKEIVEENSNSIQELVVCSKKDGCEKYNQPDDINDVNLDDKIITFMRIDCKNEAFTLEKEHGDTIVGYLSNSNSLKDLENIYSKFTN